MIKVMDTGNHWGKEQIRHHEAEMLKLFIEDSEARDALMSKSAKSSASLKIA